MKSSNLLSKYGRSGLLAALVGLLSIGAVHGQFNTLATFNSLNGSSPDAGLTLSGDGNTLYGTTDSGGTNSDGVVFSVPVSGGSTTTLATFNNTNGANPFAGLTLSGSTLYGTTTAGGANDNGTVYSVPVSGGSPTTLATMSSTAPGVYGTQPGVILSGSTLYGAGPGGANGYGGVYSVPVAGGSPTTLSSFNGTNGTGPIGNLILVGSTLYGTTYEGGANNNGAVFSVPVSGGAPTTLASFNKTTSVGTTPYGGLILVGSTLYGTTSGVGGSGYGTVFSVPIGGGAITTLATFNYTNGAQPESSLTLLGSTLYGTTEFGGANFDGTVFSLPISGGSITTLVTFNGSANGKYPTSSLTLSGDDSTLYGTTSSGGTGGDGTVFEIVVGTPEPSTWLLLLGGMGLLVFLRRRSRRALD